MLKLEGVRAYGLKPVSFELGAGECLALEGPSGSGKTVLLRTIADLDPAPGSIWLDGAERSGMSGPAWRARVRYAAAEPGWWEGTPRAHFRNPQAASKLAGAMGLEPALLDRAISRLSTGERQRLALVRALEDSPQVLLLDEPTGALDAKITSRVEKLLQGELKAGKAMILVSHDPKQLARLAARKAVIRGGSVRIGRK